MDPLRELELLKRPVPDYLYHYTSIDGLHGIIKDRSIWASMIHYLNDAAELKTAISICREILTKELRQTSDFAMKDVVGVWNAVLDDLLEETHICVVSFTEQPDLLSQWRAYCPPDGGYTIGFRTSSLEACLHEQGFVLVPCVYDKSEQENTLGRWVGDTIGALNEIAQEIDKNLTPHEEIVAKIHQMEVKVEERFVKEFHRIAPVFKHSKFSEEEEWRAISAPDPQLKFRIRRTMLFPYYEIKLNTQKFPVEKFIVGPSPHQKLAENSLKRFLRSEGIELKIEPPEPKDPNALVAANGDEDAVTFSEIPYRQL
jgi:hypothetical protein